MSDGRESESSTREEAFRRLMRIESEGAYIGLEGGGDVAPREARQATEYVAGITRWRRRLDFILGRYYHGDFEKMELPLKVVLRIGLYDLLYLDTPTYAAVNEAVALAKRKVRKGAGGLVNGVLRSVLRERESLPIPDTGQPADDLAVKLSHPTWMVRRWLDRYGQAGTTALLEWNNTRPEFGIRVNTLKEDVGAFRSILDRHGVEWEPGRYLPYFVRVKSVRPLLEHRLLQDGLCAVQDESAGLLLRLLDPQPGERIVDACAAPGGKALHAAQLMRDEGDVVAVDVHEGRLRLVEHAAEQQGVTIIRTVAADARQFDGGWEGRADRVLVDAPCTGLGVLAKRADLRWRRRPEDLAELVHLQEEILEAAARLVRPGGILVYGTCTIEPDENERRANAFSESHPKFLLEPADAYVPDTLVTSHGYYATFPPKDGIDGAFGARFRRSEE